MRDLSKAILFQKWAAEDYADARERQARPDRNALRDYIKTSQVYAAVYAKVAREAMGITDDDGTK